MTERIGELLNDLGYTSLNGSSIGKALSEGSKSIEFTKLVEWASKELQVLYNLDDHVNSIADPNESSSFLLELRGFLRELGCRYSCLMAGNANDMCQTDCNKILLLEYLLRELKAARMWYSTKEDDCVKVILEESQTASDFKSMLKALQFGRPPDNVSIPELFGKTETKLKEIISQVPAALLGEPLLTRQLSEKQWNTLEKFYKNLLLEYEIRREMLLKRLDVTIQSFAWSDRLKGKSDLIEKQVGPTRKELKFEPSVSLADVLYARKDLAVLEKTSSATVRGKTQSDVNKVIIGSVPDRGGRPNECEPPPPEMPSWQKRVTGPASGPPPNRNNFNNQSQPQRDFGQNRGGYNQGSGGGSRVQAGWNTYSASSFNDNYQNQGYAQQSQQNYQQHYQQHSGGGGYYHDSRGGGRGGGGHGNRNDGNYSRGNRRGRY